MKTLTVTSTHPELDLIELELLDLMDLAPADLDEGLDPQHDVLVHERRRPGHGSTWVVEAWIGRSLEQYGIFDDATAALSSVKKLADAGYEIELGDMSDFDRLAGACLMAAPVV